MDLPQNTTYKTGGASTAAPVKAAAPKAPAAAPTPAPAAPKPFSGPDPYGNMWGFSDQADVSGSPYIAYRTPGATATTTDPTRLAPTFNPWTPAVTPASQIQSPRMSLPESSSLKSQAGGTSKDELDHTIALELGGSNNPTNLAVESGINTPGGVSYGFDQLENSLAGQVQAGTMSLFQAQLKLATAKANAGDKGITTGQKTPIPFVGNNQTTTPAPAPDPASLATMASKQGPLSGNDLLAAQVLGTIKPNANTATMNPLGAYSGSPHQSPYAYVSSTGFKNDYIVPPYLGGASTVANQEALPVGVYNNKAAIQSVPFTLLANGLITQDQAKSMALNWRNVSASGIPTADAMGYIPVKTAQAIVKGWDNDMKGGKTPSIGSILSSVPEAVDNLGKGVIPEWARQFLVGIASGATAGGIPLDNAPGATLIDKASGLIGEAIGMYGGIVALGGLSEMAGAAMGARTVAGRALGAAVEAGVTPAGIAEATGLPFGKGAGMAIKLGIGDTLGGASVLDPVVANIAKTGAASAIRNNLAKDFVGSALKNAALFGAYGQMGQTLSDFTQPQKDVLQAHMGRLAQDLALGGIVGTFPGTWKGAGLVGFGTTMVGLFSNEGLKQSLSQGVAMAALHKVGGFAKDVAAQQEMNNQIVIRGSTNGSLEVLHRVIGDKLGLTKVDPQNPNVMTYDPAMLPEWERAAKTAIDEAERAGELKPADGASDGEAAALRKNVNEAIATLKVMALPAAERDLAATQLMSSFNRYASERYDVNSGTTPNALQPFINKVGEISPETLDAAPPKNVGEQSGRWEVDWPKTDAIPNADYNGLRSPDNGLRLTGQGANPQNAARIQSYLNGVRNGTASPTVFAVNKKTAAILFRNSNAGLTPDMIKNGAYPIDAENYMPVYGTMIDPTTGAKTIQWTGTSIPQPERIGVVSRDETGKRVVSGGKYAYNRDPAFTPQADGGLGMFPEEDHTYNNKTVNLAMKNQGVSVLPMKITAFMDNSIRPDNPYMIVKVGDDEWNLAKQVQDKVGPPPALNTLEENMADLESGRNKGNIQPIVDEVSKQLNARGHTASTIISTEKFGGINEDRQSALFEMDIKAQNILTTAHTVPEMEKGFKEKLGITLTPTEAKYALQNKSTLTGGDMKTLVEKAIVDNRVEPKTAANYLVRVKPLQDSQVYKTSPVGMIHDTMPLLTPAEAHNAQASKVSQLTGKALLEQAPITKAPKVEDATTPEYQKALEDVQMVGFGTGRQFAPQDLVSYKDDLLKVINEANVTPEEKAKLGQEAMKLINREDTNARAIFMGPQAEEGNVWEGSEADAYNKHIESVRRDIMAGTGAEDPGFASSRAKDPKAWKAISTESGKGFIKSMKDGVASLPKDSRGYAFYKTVLGGLERALGKNFENDARLIDLLSAKGWTGRQAWAKAFEEIDPRTDMPYSQPISRTRKMASGVHGKGLFEESAARNAQNAAESENIAKTSDVVKGEAPTFQTEDSNYGMTQDMIDALGGPQALEGVSESVPEGGNVEKGSQSPSEQEKDLTRWEAHIVPGLVSSDVRTPITTANGEVIPGISETTAGIEAGKMFLQKFIREGYNAAGGKMKAIFDTPDPKYGKQMTWAETTDPIIHEAQQITGGAGIVERAKAKIAAIEKQHEDLSKVGGTRAIQYAKKVQDADKETLAKLQGVIKKFGSKKPDGAGGPGTDINSPAMFFSNLAAGNAALNPAGSQSSPGSSSSLSMPGSSPSQDWGQYLSGKSVVDNTPQQPLSQVDTSGATAALNNASKQMAQIKMGPTSFTSTIPKQDPTPAAAQPGFFQNLKNTITNLMPANTSTYNKPATTAPNNNPIIAGYDTSAYAEDPIHAQKIRAIMSNIPQINSANDITGYIQRANNKSPLTGQMIWNTAQKYGVPPELVLATVQQDSSLGTLGLAVKNRNPGNVGTYVNKKGQNLVGRFPTWQAGVDAVGEWLKNHKVTGQSTTALGMPQPHQYVNQVVQN